MTSITKPSILHTLDTQVAMLIAEDQNVSQLDGLRAFLTSETHSMLADNDLRMWYFSPLALFDMWKCETTTGDPRNSLYLAGDEIA